MIELAESTMLMDSTQKEKDLLSEELTEKKQCCSDCKTTKTPMWRSGPFGPKSLCNACGIRYKKRPTPTNLKKGKKGKTEGEKVTNPFKMKNLMIPLEKEVQVLSPVMRKPRSPKMEKEVQVVLSPVIRKPRSPRNWGEVQRAAMLLMALSCGAVLAQND